MTSSPHGRGRRLRSATLATTTAVVAASFFVGLPAAHAATPDVITVKSLGLAGNAVAGTCAATASAGDCTLRGALEVANASTNPDGVRIVFDQSLVGEGNLSVTGGAQNSMTTDRVGNPSGNLADSIGPSGARFLIDSKVPVAIDFANLDGIEDVDGSGAAGIYVASDNVQLSHLNNIRAAETGIAIGGTSVTLNDVNVQDETTNWMEVGVAILDGANGVKLDGMNTASAVYANFAIDTAATVSNIEISNVTSRGVEAWAHIDVEDNAKVTNFTVTRSTFGTSSEISPSHGFWMNPGVQITDLNISDSVFQSPGKNGLYFEGTGQTFTRAVITDNKFAGTGDGKPGYDGGNISRVIGENTATWNTLTFSDNTINEAQAVKFGGTVRDATFANNSFTNINDPAFAALSLGDTLENILVTGNTFDRIWAVGTIRVEGTKATNVNIKDNTLKNLTAGVSRAAIQIAVAGTDNKIIGNTLTQDISGTDTSLPDGIDNHWAIYNSASAADKNTSVGWTITGNSIDGFGGKDRSDAPIVHNGVGKLDVTGNTFGVNTRGGTTTDVEHDRYWFLWNVSDNASNNTVQTFRVKNPRFDGTNATFTAEQPAPLIGNNAATGPVTLHVYWTAKDNAEEYLGKVDGVTAGQTVTIPTTHTNGYLRLQTVDANGFVSQYSVASNAPVIAPSTPAVTTTTATSAAGTGKAGATVIIRDKDGKDVTRATVASDGTWSVPAGSLKCGTDYTAVQSVSGVDSAATPFTTAACDTAAPAAPKITGATATSATGTGEPGAVVTLRDARGTVLGTTLVGADGSWTFAGKVPCGETITATQRVGEGPESDAGSFATPACSSGNNGGKNDGSLATTGAAPLLGGAGALLALLLIAAGSVLVIRKRAQQS